jgi:hypothetical protein
MGVRTSNIPPVRLLACVAIGLAMGVSAYALTSLHSAGGAGVAEPTPASISRNGTDASAVAERFAAALNTMDYREPDKWLESLRPLTTDREFMMLKGIYLPMSWDLFEREGRVVSRNRVHVADVGLQAQGQHWEIRLLEVEVTGLSQNEHSTRLRMYVLLSQEDAGWRVASVLTDKEVRTFSEAAQ